MRLFLLLLTSGLVAVPVFAHESGESYEAEVNGYAVDVGYSTDSPTDEEVVLFDFQLQQDGKDVPFTDAWVKIENEQKVVVFAGGMYRAEYGGARLSYRFPEAGTYQVSIRYEDGDRSLAEVSVPLSVAGTDRTSATPLIAFVAGAALSALAAGAYVWKRRR